MIRELRLVNFKAFERLTVSFRGQSIILGPNNAGKSTVLSALRASVLMLRQASRLRPHLRDDVGEQGWTYNLEADAYDLPIENLRHEFRANVETRLQIAFKDGATLRAVWPGEDTGLMPYFLLVAGNGVQPRTPTEVRRAFPRIGVIPMLSPVEHDERLLDAEYVGRNVQSRLASRHFRNHLYLLAGRGSTSSGAFAEYQKFIEPWLPELRLQTPVRRDGPDGAELDVFFDEGRVPKELCWAGDGMQVYLQLLFHLYRSKDEVDAVILDEPDVYLHADLQRRVVRLLNSLSIQAILATHSSEIAGEADPQALVWLDKTRSRAVRAPTEGQLMAMTAAIGSQFNLRLARALRARLALFVEGKDMVILTNLAGIVGAEKLASESGVAIVGMGGGSNWRSLEGFGWISRDLLADSVPGYVILDRDYHVAEEVALVRQRIRDFGLEIHVWKRKELESFLIHPEAIARISGASPGQVIGFLNAEVDLLRPEVTSKFISAFHAERRESRLDIASTSALALDHVEQLWSGTAEARWEACPAKDLISGINGRLTDAGLRPISARSLSRALQPDEIPDEMLSVLRQLETLLS